MKFYSETSAFTDTFFSSLMESMVDSHAREADHGFQQAEFLAEDEIVDISPMVRSDIVTLVRGNFGPFEPNITTSVRASPFCSTVH